MGDGGLDDTRRQEATSHDSSPSAKDVSISKGPAAVRPEESSEYYLELIIDTLKQLDHAAQGAFLQKFLRSLTNVDVSEEDSVTHWEQILKRRGELAERMERHVSLRTAAVDYFGELLLLRNPILLEYSELKRLRHSAATDALTGLNNRRIFEEYLEREISRSSRYGSSFTLILLDLRRFKRANDTYGHAVGDEILRSVARACTEAIRASDICCRIGGDEFAIMLPQAERASVEALAERIARKFEDYVRTLTPDAPVGLDYGVAAYPGDGENAASLFGAADRNMYAYKQRAHQLEEARAAESRPYSSRIEPSRKVSANADAQEGQAPSLESLAIELPPQPASELPPRVGEPNGLGRQPRRYERIPLEGARGLGVVRLGAKSKVVKVLDLSFGGVSLLVDKQNELPETFPARLHVPLLPDAELTLHRIYSRQLPGGKQRVGCSFAPLGKVGSA